MRFLYGFSAFAISVLRIYFVKIFYCRNCIFMHPVMHHAHSFPSLPSQRRMPSRDARFCVSRAIHCNIRMRWIRWEQMCSFLVRRKILRLYFCWTLIISLIFPNILNGVRPVETQNFASPDQSMAIYACGEYAENKCLSSLWDARFCVSTFVGSGCYAWAYAFCRCRPPYLQWNPESVWQASVWNMDKI